MGNGFHPHLAWRCGDIKWPRLLSEAQRVKRLKRRDSEKSRYLEKGRQVKKEKAAVKQRRGGAAAVRPGWFFRLFIQRGTSPPPRPPEPTTPEAEPLHSAHYTFLRAGRARRTSFPRLPPPKERSWNLQGVPVEVVGQRETCTDEEAGTALSGWGREGEGGWHGEASRRCGGILFWGRRRDLTVR